jgi:hypothetical protein
VPTLAGKTCSVTTSLEPEAGQAAAFGLREVRIAGFRSARSVSFRPGAVCALVGEAGVGKSNLLAALWTLLEPLAPPPAPDDASRGSSGEILLAATLADGSEISLRSRPPRSPVRAGAGPPVVFLPAELRMGALVASPPSGLAPDAARFASGLRSAGAGATSSAGPATVLVEALEACCRDRLSGVVLLVEEPELFLRPQAQRYLYRLLRDLAANGNQVIYSTHAPAFLNVGRLGELAVVKRHHEVGTTIVQPRPLPTDEGFRALSEFDAERSELFLARAALLVEGLSEKLVFPFLFRALGHDPDREAISIVECGGKPNIPLFARICEAAHVPYLVVYDRDAPRGRRPIQAERAVNAAIVAVAGTERTIELVPDFEGVAGLHAHSHKPAHAWRAFATADRTQVPEPLAEAVRRVLALARD